MIDGECKCPYKQVNQDECPCPDKRQTIVEKTSDCVCPGEEVLIGNVCTNKTG